MPLTFDATMKDLVKSDPGGFFKTFVQPTNSPISLLNVDLSAVTAAPDFVIGIGKPLKEIIQFDFQTGPDGKKHLGIFSYNSLLYRFYEVPVRSVLILLRKEAEHPNVNGVITYPAGLGHPEMTFHYQIIRLWEIPAKTYLTGEIGTIPLALLGKLPTGMRKKARMKQVVDRIIERVTNEAPP